METADVRKGVLETMARARQKSADRRSRSDTAAIAFESLLQHTATPLLRQVANVLRVEGYAFTLSTPAGSVRLMSDKSADDFIEIGLDSGGDAARVVGRISHRRGRHVDDIEQIVGSGDPASISEADLFAFVMKELEPFVER